MPNTVEIISEGLRELKATYLFNGALYSLLDKIFIGELGCSAYRHKLGFLCLEPDIDLLKNHQLRFHIWDGRKYEIEEFHNHRYSFISYVLKGSIINEIVNVKNNNGGKFNHFKVSYVEGNSVRTKISEGVSVMNNVLHTLQKGEFYQLNENDFHRSYPKSLPTITVLFRNKIYSKKKADVISINNHLKEKCLNKLMTIEQLRNYKYHM